MARNGPARAFMAHVYIACRGARWGQPAYFLTMHKKPSAVATPKISRTPPKPKLIPQPRGGALLAGGMPGNRGNIGKASGRRSEDYLNWLAKLMRSPRMKRRLRKLVRTGRNGELLQLHKTLLERTYGAPNQKLTTTVTLADLLGAEDPTAV